MDKANKPKSYYSVRGRSRFFGSSQNWPGMGDQRIVSHCPDNQSSRQEIKPFWLGRTASGMAWFYSLAQGQHGRIPGVTKLSGAAHGWLENLSIRRWRQLAQRTLGQTISQRTCKSYIGVSSAVSSRTQSPGKDLAHDSL